MEGFCHEKIHSGIELRENFFEHPISYGNIGVRGVRVSFRLPNGSKYGSNYNGVPLHNRLSAGFSLGTVCF